ncbi:MAG TPA: hypothetical protein VGN38_01000 [Caulobacteraceae bacterium]|nr:hypothetical protein [Caulobacteraceae bacterium]
MSVGSASRWVAPGVALVALSACHPPFHHRGQAYRAVTTLDCPATQGELSRKSAAADGKSCAYATANGESVTLQLVSVSGNDVDAALTPLETSLRAEVPAAETKGEGPGEGRVDIDLPGIHIHASGKDQNGGDHVRIGRDVSIGGGNTVISDSRGGVDIQARDQGAEIHVNEGHGNIRRDFVLASDTPGPHGFKVAAYEARGPQGGPVVVGSLLAKSDDHDQLNHDMRALVRANVVG